MIPRPMKLQVSGHPLRGGGIGLCGADAYKTILPTQISLEIVPALDKLGTWSSTRDQVRAEIGLLLRIPGPCPNRKELF